MQYADPIVMVDPHASAHMQELQHLLADSTAMLSHAQDATERASIDVMITQVRAQVRELKAAEAAPPKEEPFAMTMSYARIGEAPAAARGWGGWVGWGATRRVTNKI